MYVGDTLTVNSRAGDSTPKLFWLPDSSCAGKPLKHNPLGGVVLLPPAFVGASGGRLRLVFQATGNYTYTSSAARDCKAGMFNVTVLARDIVCKPFDTGCPVSSTSTACFCNRLAGFFPVKADGCSSAYVCTGVTGTSTMVTCPTGQRFDAVFGRCTSSNIQCGPRGDFLAGYIGAWTDGQAPPRLTTTPGGGFQHILSFAVESNLGTGKMREAWDYNVLTPQAVAAAKRQGKRFMVSVGGWGGWFSCPDNHKVSRATYVRNAVNDLLGYVREYGLDGIDLNHEGCPAGVKGSCVDSKGDYRKDSACYQNVWGSIVKELKRRNSRLLITVSPYRDTWTGVYKQLMTGPNGRYIDLILYQGYAHRFYTDPTAMIDTYRALARDVGGWSKLVYGTCTTARPLNPRGVQPPMTYDAYRGLRALGVGGAFTWSLEDSAAWQARMRQPDYTVEKTLAGMTK